MAQPGLYLKLKKTYDTKMLTTEDDGGCGSHTTEEGGVGGGHCSGLEVGHVAWWE